MSKMRQDLREEKTKLTRDRIMLGLAAEIVKRGPHDVTIQAVADHAGVSHRTVYRHFSSKDELFQAYGRWFNERLEGSDTSTTSRSLRYLSRRIPDVYGQFEDEAQLIEAYVRIGALAGELDVQRRRTRSFVEAVGNTTDELQPEYQRSVAILLRQIAGSHAWHRARHQHGVDSNRFGETAAWLVDLVADALESGSTPDAWKHNHGDG